jgi:hypothetical protein
MEENPSGKSYVREAWRKMNRWLDAPMSSVNDRQITLVVSYVLMALALVDRDQEKKIRANEVEVEEIVSSCDNENKEKMTDEIIPTRCRDFCSDNIIISDAGMAEKDDYSQAGALFYGFLSQEQLWDEGAMTRFIVDECGILYADGNCGVNIYTEPQGTYENGHWNFEAPFSTCDGADQNNACRCRPDASECELKIHYDDNHVISIKTVLHDDYFGRIAETAEMYSLTGGIKATYDLEIAVNAEVLDNLSHLQRQMEGASCNVDIKMPGWFNEKRYRTQTLSPFQPMELARRHCEYECKYPEEKQQKNPEEVRERMLVNGNPVEMIHDFDADFELENVIMRYQLQEQGMATRFVTQQCEDLFDDPESGCVFHRGFAASEILAFRANGELCLCSTGQQSCTYRISGGQSDGSNKVAIGYDAENSQEWVSRDIEKREFIVDASSVPEAMKKRRKEVQQRVIKTSEECPQSPVLIIP